MWSDQTSPEHIRGLAAEVRSVLPAPAKDASSARIELRGKATVEQAAELLHLEPGFAWLNSSVNSRANCDGPCLLHSPLASVTYSDGRAVVTGPGGSVTLSGRGFDILQAMIEAWSGPPQAMLAGFLSYDLALELEELGPVPQEDLRFPRFHFGLYDSALVHRKVRGSEGWTLSGTDAWRPPMSSVAAEDLLGRAEAIVPRAPEARRSSDSLSSSLDRAAFESAVERIVASIFAGDFFQTNLCRSIDAPLEQGREWDLFRRMRCISPARYEAFLRTAGQQTVCSISPEMFLKLDGGIVESAPIKGTRPRGRTVEEDDALSAELFASEKDRAELAMIVDVVRNDLARVCSPGSIEVVKHAELMNLPTVHHLVSTVRGRLRADTGVVDLLRAAFPAASISGAPKIEAMRVAMREEGQLRGPCMGAIGWISLDGRMELSVAIRTAFATEGRVHYYAGCGITADSEPSAEFQESRHKASAFVRALGAEQDPNW